MKRLGLTTVVIGLVTFGACGGGSDPANQDSSGAAASSPAASSSRSRKVVPHEQLLALLPAIPGWARDSEARGDTDRAENVSRVQVNYAPSGPDKSSSLSIEIVDSTGSNDMVGPLRDFIRANRATTTGTGDLAFSTTPAQVLGFPAMQEWTPAAKNGTLGILVADRFTVGITANNVIDPEVMRKAAEAIDLKKLASLK